MEAEKKNLKMMEKCGNYNKWIADTLRPYVSGNVLEVGVGNGSVARYFFNKKYYGIDIDEEHVNYCNDLFKTKNFFKVDVEKGLPAFFRHKFDTVICVNVLEHVFNDNASVDNAWRMLKKGGKLVIIVPAHQWNYGSIDRADNHYRRYDLKRLVEMFNNYFIVENYKQINLAGALGWYVTGKVFPTNTHRSGELGLFDKLVPLFRWCEERHKIPFGLSLFVVGEKI